MNTTKGNWYVGEDNDVFTDAGACIAKVCGAPDGIAESLDNAHLMAAAPDMRAALSVARAALVNNRMTTTDKAQKAVEMIDAALSKAEAK